MRISLVPLNGDKPYVVTLPLTLVGRKEDCDFRLEGPGVAGLHCVIAQADDLLLLRDLDTGKTHVNGQRIRRAVLLPNDPLSVGDCRFRVQYEAEGLPQG